MRPKIDLAAAAAAVQHQLPATLTVAELVAGFTARNPCDYDWRLRKWVQAFGQLSAWELTSEALEAAAEAMVGAGYKPSTVNRDLSALGTCYKWARKLRLSPRGFRSPTLAIRRYDEGIRRVEVSAEQIATIKARALTVRDRRFGAFVHLLVDTGARKSELLERRWRDVDLERGQILCPSTKTGVPRVLHFRPETAQLMRRVWRTMPEQRLLFEGRVPDEPVDYRKSWQGLVNALGYEGLHMHDIRHAAAANLLRAGVTLGVAAQVLGHDPAVLARRYGHLELQTLRAAQEQAWQASETALQRPSAQAPVLP